MNKGIILMVIVLVLSCGIGNSYAWYWKVDEDVKVSVFSHDFFSFQFIHLFNQNPSLNSVV